jgi:hypothetical protein
MQAHIPLKVVHRLPSLSILSIRSIIHSPLTRSQAYAARVVLHHTARPSYAMPPSPPPHLLDDWVTHLLHLPELLLIVLLCCSSSGAALLLRWSSHSSALARAASICPRRSSLPCCLAPWHGRGTEACGWKVLLWLEGLNSLFKKSTRALEQTA